MTNPNDLIEQAQAMLEPEQAPAIVVEERASVPEHVQYHTPVVEELSVQSHNLPATSLPRHSSELMPQGSESGIVTSYEPPAPALQATVFQKFGDLPTHLREGEGIDLIAVKKLNLAVAVEGLERASTAHENFPSPDAGFALAAMTEQVLKLTKDLEKSNDPQTVLENIQSEVLSRFVEEVVVDLSGEMKNLMVETRSLVRPDKIGTYEEAFKTAVNRLGPAFQDRLSVSRRRLARALNIKEKKSDGRGSSST